MATRVGANRRAVIHGDGRGPGLGDSSRIPSRHSRRAAIAAALLAASAFALPGCGSCGKAGGLGGRVSGTPGDTGGIQVSDGVKRLCSVNPDPGDGPREDGTPIVLWSGSTPAAILQYREARDNFGTWKMEAHLVPVDGAERRGPFPLDYYGKVLDQGPSPEMLDPRRVSLADLDGDGTQELIVFRHSGEAEVHGLRGQYAHERARGGRPQSPHRVRFGAREVLYVPMIGTDSESRASVRPAVLRFDERGIRRIELDGYAPKDEVVGVGVVVKPDADDIEELTVIFERDFKAYLARHTPDGKPIGEPRLFYVPFSTSLGIRVDSLPRSGRIVAYDSELRVVHFIAPQKPVNWVRRVDLSALPNEDFQLLGALDDPDGAKVLVRSKNELFAVDEQSRWLTWSGSAWTPNDKPTPYLRLPEPRDGERIIDAVVSPTRPDEVLVVYTRPARVRDLPTDEIERAAARFLEPWQLKRAREDRPPRLDDDDFRRDDWIAEERKKRGVSGEITDVETWRRLLPDSYSRTERRREAQYRETLLLSLTLPSARPSEDVTPRDAELHVWLRSAEIAAETTLYLIRRDGLVSKPTVTGEATWAFSELPLPWMDFRSDPAGAITAVRALHSAGGAGSPLDPGLYLIHLPAAR